MIWFIVVLSPPSVVNVVVTPNRSHTALRISQWLNVSVNWLVIGYLGLAR
jgi:hypothetical protein